MAAEECPKSLVTPQSLEWIEKFLSWKFAGVRAVDHLPARDADAKAGRAAAPPCSRR